jgi:hypothetical protein
MTWLESHSISERLAGEAENLLRAGDELAAKRLFAEAAAQEEAALLQLESSKVRTWGITAVSAAALWFKAGDFRSAEKVSYAALSNDELPRFAGDNLELILQSIWTQRDSRNAGVPFLPGQVIVAIDGGEVVRGAAPLDLVVSKVQTIQALFYRTIELLRGMPHRSQGGPIREIQEACRPWLLQAPPGSYQFAVAIQEPIQRDFFKEGTPPQEVANTFLAVLKAAGAQDIEGLERIVPDASYRPSFLKLTRNLAPTGKSYARLTVRTADQSNGVVLLPENRAQINRSLRESSTDVAQSDAEVVYNGILRAVDLDHDWIEVTVGHERIHVSGLKETIDDVIGPMVNHPVVVRALRKTKGHPQFVDIEADE